MIQEGIRTLPRRSSIHKSSLNWAEEKVDNSWGKFCSDRSWEMDECKKILFLRALESGKSKMKAPNVRACCHVMS